MHLLCLATQVLGQVLVATVDPLNQVTVRPSNLCTVDQLSVGAIAALGRCVRMQISLFLQVVESFRASVMRV